MKAVPTRWTRIRAEAEAASAATLFRPVDPAAPHPEPSGEPEREPILPGLAPDGPARGETAQGETAHGETAHGETARDAPAAGAPGPPPSWMLMVAVAAILLSGMLGVVAIGALDVRDQVAAQQQARAEQEAARQRGLAPFGVLPAVPSTPEPSRGAAPGEQADGAVDFEIVTDRLDVDTAVELPGPGSRDWVAPGAGSGGGLVRADLTEESIEFRAANTQPGLPGTFRLSWRGGTPEDDREDASGMLGIRPGGRVDFVVRPLDSPADLVLHVSGNDVAVTVSSQDGFEGRVLSAAAAVVTVALPARTAATVTVSPDGTDDIAVATAELR